MKVFTIANQKGGVGKTVFSTHLAFYLAEQGLKGIFIDLDTQANATYVLSNKYPSNLYSYKMFDEDYELELSDLDVTLLQGSDELANINNPDKVNDIARQFVASIEKLKESDLDFCVIDTAPSLSPILLSALVSSDYAICPVCPENLALQGVGKLVNTILEVKDINSDLDFLGVLISKLDKRNPRHTDYLNAFKEQYGEIVIPNYIASRNAIEQATAEQIPVWDVKKTTARVASKEMKDAIKYIMKKAEIAPKKKVKLKTKAVSKKKK